METQSTEERLSLQEIFNIVWNGMKGQNFEPAVHPDFGTCQYRAPNGHKCAIGHLLTDEEAEGLAGTFLLIRDEGKVPARLAVIRDNELLGAELQACHDRSVGSGWPDDIALAPKRLEANLREFAKAHSLSVPE